MPDEFVPRPAFSIDWERRYDCGPSDPHLHAMGQFMANYSMVEWSISKLFQHYVGLNHKEAQRLAMETNMSMAGMIRYVKSKAKDFERVDRETSRDLVYTLEEFEKLSPLRNKIVHWQWGLNEGETATLSDLIKPKSAEKGNASLALDELRDNCLYLMKIFQALSLGEEVVTARMTRAMIQGIRKDTLPEKLFRPFR